MAYMFFRVLSYFGGRYQVWKFTIISVVAKFRLMEVAMLFLIRSHAFSDTVTSNIYCNNESYEYHWYIDYAENNSQQIEPQLGVLEATKYLSTLLMLSWAWNCIFLYDSGSSDFFTLSHYFCLIYLATEVSSP